MKWEKGEREMKLVSRRREKGRGSEKLRRDDLEGERTRD